MTRPTVQVSLDSQGNLCLGLPGVGDTVRWLPLRDTEASPAIDTIKRVLVGLANSHTGIGTEGAPTGQQLTHWQKHSIWPDEKCPFCQADARAAAMLQAIEVQAGGQTVTRIAAGKRAPAQFKTNKSAQDLGL
jgi:cytosine/adenosine deaminase-related metal-dependent hydrolase